MDETLNQSQEQSPPSTKKADKPEDKASRLDAAKAFFRALNAGEEPSPADYGMGPPPQAASAVGPCRSCSQMESQLVAAEQKQAEAESLYKRMAADFDNYRRRIEREKEEFQALGVQKMVEALLPALDDMDRAATSLTAQMPPEKILESLKLVYNRLTKCMEQVGVKVMSSVGEVFDPRFHEPVQEVETTEVPDGCVVQELRRGYSLNEKVIRPSLVNVASNPQTVAPTAMAETQALAVCEGVEEEPAEGEEKIKVYDLSEFEDDVPEIVNGAVSEAPVTGKQISDE